MSTITLTEKELEVLRAYKNSDYYQGMNEPVWDYSVNEELTFKGKTRSGVISSLVQKNILSVYKKEKGNIAGTYALIMEEVNKHPEILEIFK